MALIDLRFEPPSRGWLTIRLSTKDKHVVIDASNVPNNPLQELIEALEAAATGSESSVWWNLEPDGYFMTFKPNGPEVHFDLAFATRSDKRLAYSVFSLCGSKAEVLMPFWRFLRDFESRSVHAPGWPNVDFSRMQALKAKVLTADEA